MRDFPIEGVLFLSNSKVLTQKLGRIRVNKIQSVRPCLFTIQTLQFDIRTYVSLTGGGFNYLHLTSLHLIMHACMHARISKELCPKLYSTFPQNIWLEGEEGVINIYGWSWVLFQLHVQELNGDVLQERKKKICKAQCALFHIWQVVLTPTRQLDVRTYKIVMYCLMATLPFSPFIYLYLYEYPSRASFFMNTRLRF